MILLDLGLPDRDGREVIKELRRITRAPILILSARGQEHEKVLLLDLGADDYLTKPFGAAELLAAAGSTLSDVLREIPPTTILQRKIPCAWENKGSLMRMLTTYAKGKPSQFVDGVKVFEGEDWALIYPSQDEAYFHLVVESGERPDAERLADQYTELFAAWGKTL